ncbi:hypothetical protein [Cellulomonas hominis]
MSDEEMTVQRIAEWYGGTPDGWGSWFPGRGPEEADRVAQLLADGEAAQARVRETVLAFDAARIEADILSMAIWVPDRTTGEAAADLNLLIMRTESGTSTTAAEVFETQKRKPRQRGVKLYHYDVSISEVNAGEAVIATRTHAGKKAKQVVTTVEWTVIPPDSCELLLLVMTTPYAALAEMMADQSVVIVNELSVDLEQV